MISVLNLAITATKIFFITIISAIFWSKSSKGIIDSLNLNENINLLFFILICKLWFNN